MARGSGARSRSRSPRAAGAAQKAAASEPAHDEEVTTLLAQAHECLVQLPPQSEAAHKHLEQALALAPRDTRVLDTFGGLLCQEGSHERARELLLRSIKLAPKTGAEKFLNLAQMSSGEEARKYFARGARTLQAEIVALISSASEERRPAVMRSRQVTDLRRQLAQTEASVAELYMTDLCDLDEAEKLCEESCSRALEADGKCIEALTTQAMLRKVQGNIDEARKLALRAARFTRAALAVSAGEDHVSSKKQEAQGDEEKDLAEVEDEHEDNEEEEEEMEDEESEQDAQEGLDEVQESQKVPSKGHKLVAGEEMATVDEDAIMALSRVLVDLEKTEEASELLSGVLDKDEDNLQVWSLLAQCHIVEKDREAALECVQQGLLLCKKLGPEAREDRQVFRELLKDAKALAPAPDTGDAEEADATAGVDGSEGSEGDANSAEEDDT